MSLRDLWDYNKRSNSHVIRVAEDEKENAIEKVLEQTLPENSLNLARDINLLIQEAEQDKQDKPKDIHTEILYN